MATAMKCQIMSARHGGYRADYLHRGEWKRVFFANQRELAFRLCIDGVRSSDVEAAIDAFEEVEVDEPHTVLEVRPLWLCYLRSVGWIGIVTAPWIALMIFARWFGVWI
jgi:hypothetical protein